MEILDALDAGLGCFLIPPTKNVPGRLVLFVVGHAGKGGNIVIDSVPGLALLVGKLGFDIRRPFDA